MGCKSRANKHRSRMVSGHIRQSLPAPDKSALEGESSVSSRILREEHLLSPDCASAYLLLRRPEK